jgi:dTDP-4-dehydrorhamnose 3,5-epimerase-like enzyme
VSYGQLNTGLVDCREGSPTYGRTAKVILTPHVSVYIPAGVAHGYANESYGVAVLQYLPDRQFTRGDESEEWRIDPERLPYDFVLAETM